MADKDSAEVLKLIFGYPYQANKEIKGIPIVLRTLYDFEMADALSRSMKFSGTEEQMFSVKRWRLAYSIISVNATEFPPEVDKRHDILASWPNYFVEMCYDVFETINEEEDELKEILSKPTGTEQTPTTD